MNIKNTKKLLKKYKLNESTISMVLGALVIIIAGMLVVNYFKGLDKGSSLPTVETTENADALPTTYQVQKGDDLWKISERFYGSGYNWVDIAKENNISNPNTIEEGQTLNIPKLNEVAETATPEAEKIAEATETPKPTDEVKTEEPTVAPTATIAPTATVTPEPTKVVVKEETKVEETKTSSEDAISGDTYTVVHGDSLWKIAQRAYGDGNQWMKIAKANKLIHPSVIHAGNSFVIPR